MTEVGWGGVRGSTGVGVGGGGCLELICYTRGNTEDVRVSRYVKTTVQDLEETKQSLETERGMPTVTVHKVRSVILFEQTRIHLDRVRGLKRPFFLELEVMLRPTQTHEEGQAIVHGILLRLGITEEERCKLVERGSCGELLLLGQ